METLISHTPRAPPSESPAPAKPLWVLLNPQLERRAKDDDSSVAADANTAAACCTSWGQSFTVSFALAAPPARSIFYCRCLDGKPKDDDDDDDDEEDDNNDVEGSMNLSIIAAHDGCILMQARVPNRYRSGYGSRCDFDYFLYDTGGAARPPSLSLLPGCYISRLFQRHKVAGNNGPFLLPNTRFLDMENTGVLRHGDGEVRVATLEITYDSPYDTAELCVLRAGGEWALQQVAIVHHEGGFVENFPEIDAVVSVGVRFMCWVDYLSGFFVYDMEAQKTSLELVYVPLPVPQPERHWGNSDRPHMQYCRTLAAAGPDTVRLVEVAPRCCCGGHGKTECERSRFAFNVTTWTLTLRMEGPMKWVKDSVVDCDEIWQIPNYGCLPRVAPRYPFVSSGNSDVVCFMLCEDHYQINNADKTVWLLEMDTKRKELLSFVRSDVCPYIVYSQLAAKFYR
ncbi:unnamed protein product [Urochloa humidicola]